MSYQAEVYEILISSPSDVVEECKIVFEEINKWNQNFSKSNQIVFLPVNWQTHSIPESGERIQETLNKQIVRDSDVLIAIFWTRIGSPTGIAESGTIEEINEFINAGKPVSIYFSKLPKHQDQIDNLQYEKLKKFQGELYKNQKVLCAEFYSLENFGEMINKLFIRTAQKLKSTENKSKIKASEIEWDEEDVDFVKIYNQAVGRTIDKKIENKFNNLTIDGGTF
jgi:nucleoside 2-deoxyribosyltransferase